MFRSSRFIWIVAASTFFVGAVISVMTGDEGQAAAEVAASPSPSPSASEKAEVAPVVAKPGACLADAAVLEDLRKQREAIVARQKELTAKEDELKAREQALNEQFRNLEEARGDLGKVDAARRKENDEKVAKLVETFETMNPKASSAILATLDDSLAVAAMARMSTPKLAKVMNVMEPKRSSYLTELLAGVVRAKGESVRRLSNASTADDASVTAKKGKGGEKTNDELNKQSEQSGMGAKPSAGSR